MVNISTISEAGGEDYTSVAAWEADTDNDLVTAANGEEGRMTDASTFTGGGKINGATTDATHFRVLRAKPNDEYDPASGAGVIIQSSGGGTYIMNVAEDYAQFRYVAVESTNTGTSVTRVIRTAGSNWLVIGCTSINRSCTSSSTSSSLFHNQGTAGGECISCLAIGGEGADAGAVIGFRDESGNAGIYNCVAYGIDNGTVGGNTVGFWMLNASSIVKNCVAYGTELVDFALGGSTVSSNNASGDSSGDITGVVDTAGTDWVDAPNYDFRPVATGLLNDAGTSSPAAVDSAMDKNNDHGTDNATWEIGCYDQASNSGAPPDTVHPTYARRYEHTAAPNTSLRM